MHLLAGKPLLQYAIAAAKGAANVSETYVSTDDDEIAEYARSQGAQVPFLRDPSLSGDTVHGTEPVLDLLQKEFSGEDDFFCVRILPPYPFLQSATIDALVKRSVEERQNVLSVVPLDINEFHLRTLDPEGYMHPVSANVKINFQIEDAPQLYALSGAAQCAPVPFLLRERSYQRGSPFGFPIDKLEGFEIDTPDALALAERMMR